MSASLLRDIRASADLGAGDLVANLVAVLQDANAVRQTAIATGQSALALRAGTATREVISDLFDLLGIDADSSADELRAGEILAKSVARAVRETPAFGEALAAHIETFNDLRMAVEVRALAARSTGKALS